ncbi:MAG TPA: hypothetical protein PKD96_03855 [Candidatus Absconditabacterales bacterium]|nr:hypothetical protein [Candidatus Absconditabacterales bacterium]
MTALRQAQGPEGKWIFDKKKSFILRLGCIGSKNYYSETFSLTREMKENIQLFTGEVDYLLLEELKRYKVGFTKKFGKENIFEFFPDQFNPGQVINAIFGGGLFVTKKLVIIHGFPAETDKTKKIGADASEKFEQDFFKYFDHVSPDTVVIFVAASADKRTKSYKELISKGATIKLFEKPKGDRAKTLSQYVKNRLGDLTDEKTAQQLVQQVGDNLYHLKNESEKIRAYCSYHKITKVDEILVDKIVFKNQEVNNFELFKRLFSDKRKVLSLIDEAKAEGTNWNLYLGLLLRGIKNILLTIDQYSLGQTSSFHIAGKIGGHPATIASMLKIIDTLLEKENSLKTVYKSLTALDLNIKNGKYPDSIFWPEVKKILYEI